MRYFLFSLLTLTLLVSCVDKNEKAEKFLPDASGAINNVSVVTENEYWDGRVGEAIRQVLAKPIYGLPQDEPMFTISQIPPSVFSGFVTKNRTVLKVETNKPAGITFSEDVYAKPQKVIVVSGNTKEEIIEVVKENEAKIIETFRNSELDERQRQMAKSPHNFNTIKEKLGLTIKFSLIYEQAKQEGNFFWFRKDITTGHSHIMLYELPFDAVTRNDSTVGQIIKIRDSIGQAYFKGRLDGTVKANGDTVSSFMVTEPAYTPFFGETILDNKPALVTKGLWELTNDFMGGPFINYMIEDKVNKRWVVVEAFIFAPSVEKRNYMLELESVIKSVKIE
ncbi:DUF4837 family protein [Algibacter amylolyticus]|uniref:DUF4837 family protein n=1 Tax=Algibacter amylolyticus TaxID=1608400 RepID=A0A5M7BIX6_9FLAO|nr:DUF4837 family protein [Algibacter amylolyticus]KAA5827431.1 DUF4837 family protein [Algibacter amylolyticus]MBB5266623.1 hypothetical protein [Algibacter amylolyticus]TSJ81676.1 DUF4837 family protein [Algibacter amylolyticus]